MPFNGAGVYTLPAGNPVVTGTVISSAVQNNTMSDVATALTDCVTRDGQSPPTQNLPMGGFQITGLGNATTRGAAPNAGQIQDGGLVTLVTVAGTDTITAGVVPAITAYTAGQTFDFLAVGANTTNVVTLNVSALGARPVTKFGTAALSPGDIVTGQSVRVRFDGTQFQVISPLSVSSPFSFRNKFINGRFDIWQRGLSFSAPATGTYTADRWIYASGSGGAATVSAAAVTIGDAFSQGRLAMQIAQTTLSVSAPFLVQRIENVRTMAGKTIVVSLTGFVASGTAVVTPTAIQSFGTGGSPSTQVQTNLPTFTLTTTEQTLTASVALPSIAGKTLGTNNDDYLIVGFNFPIGVTFNATILQTQVEEGYQTPFENLPYQTTIALCQRYYWRGVPCTGINFGSYAANAFYTVPVAFPVQMRNVPALSNTLGSATYSQCTLSSVDQPSTTGCRINLQGSATATNSFASFNLTANYIEATAEL